MSLLFTGGVALAYTLGVVGLHRWGVYRRRARAGHFTALEWLDWDTLLSGVWPAGAPGARTGVSPREGGPPPRCLAAPPAPGREAAHGLLVRLVHGDSIASADFTGAGFSGGESRWLTTLSERVTAPDVLLARMGARAPESAAEAYLYEWLSLKYAVSPLSVEWEVYATKRRLSAALRRFGEVPALYFVRARASSLLGFTQSVLDDLGRAVFFSREAPFYVDAVLAMPFVAELRPPLARACREARERMRGEGEERLDADADSE
ncbi:MAG: hypothetical protein IAE78_01830 [Myxococcus sp.]|nr:hypothetical protein [Myxococcus sp.]